METLPLLACTSFLLQFNIIPNLIVKNNKRHLPSHNVSEDWEPKNSFAGWLLLSLSAKATVSRRLDWG